MNEFEEKVALISCTSLIQAHFSCNIILLTDACLRNILSLSKNKKIFFNFKQIHLAGDFPFRHNDQAFVD